MGKKSVSNKEVKDKCLAEQEESKESGLERTPVPVNSS